MTDQDQKFDAPSLFQGLVIFFVALGLAPLIALGADFAVKTYADEVYRLFQMGEVRLEGISAMRVLALLAENLASALKNWTDFLIYLAIAGLPFFVVFQLIAPRFFFNRPLAMAASGMVLALALVPISMIFRFLSFGDLPGEVLAEVAPIALLELSPMTVTVAVLYCGTARVLYLRRPAPVEEVFS